MVRENNYGLVDWYIDRYGFDVDFKDKEKREDVKEVGAEDFFDKIIGIAKDLAPTAEKASSIASLRNNNKFKNKSIDKIQGGSFIDKANEFFNKQLKNIVDKSNLPGDRKNKLIGEVKNYNSEREFETLVNNEVKNYEKDLEQIEEIEQEQLAEQEKEILQEERKIAERIARQDELKEIKEREQEAKTKEEYLQAREEREELSRRSVAQTERRQRETVGRAITDLGSF